MTVIRPNSISGITSITAQANDINFFRSDGTLAALQINGINFNNTSGISTLAALNVTGNVSIAGTLTYEDVTNVDSIGIITARSTIDAQGSINLADSIIHTGDTDTKIQFGTDTIIFDTAGGERVRIASDGKVGIGTITPEAVLHVEKNGTDQVLARFESNMGTSNNRAVTLSSPETDSLSNYFTFATGNSFKFKVDTINALCIASDGNIGINQSTPTAKLQVTGGGAYTVAGSGRSVEGIDIQSSSGDVNGAFGGAISFGVGNAGRSAIAAVQNNADDDNVGLAFFTHPSNTGAADAEEKVRIISDGKVGIGITNPTGNLHISSGTSGDCQLIIESDTDNNDENDNPRIIFRQDGGNDISAIENLNNELVISNSVVSDGGIIFKTGSTNGYTNAAERMRISPTGAVTKPTQPCAVVYQCTGPAGGAANADSDNKEPLHFDHVHINQGGMTISGNNGRIEVPVTGIYFVSYMVSGTVSNVDTNDGIELLLLVNGNEYPSSNSGIEPVFNFGHGHNSSVTSLEAHTEFACTNTILVSLTAGDYLEVALDNIGNSDGNVNRGNFNVMLMA